MKAQMMRARAIVCALWFGLLPWWIYEERCHFRPWGYWRHLAHNLGYAWRWVTLRETVGDTRFELQTNARPRWHRWMRRHERESKPMFEVICRYGHKWPWPWACGGCTYVREQYPQAVKRATRMNYMCHLVITDTPSIAETIRAALQGSGRMPDGSSPLDWVLNYNESKGPFEMTCLRYFLLGEHPGDGRRAVLVQRDPCGC